MEKPKSQFEFDSAVAGDVFDFDKTATGSGEDKSVSLDDALIGSSGGNVHKLTPKKTKPAQSKNAAPKSGDPSTKKSNLSNDARFQIALAKEKAVWLAEKYGDAKLLEYQINEILKPYFVNDALQKPISRISKLLASHATIKK